VVLFHSRGVHIKLWRWTACCGSKCKHINIWLSSYWMTVGCKTRISFPAVARACLSCTLSRGSLWPIVISSEWRCSLFSCGAKGRSSVWQLTTV
jgi:hypothetical protein